MSLNDKIQLFEDKVIGETPKNKSKDRSLCKDCGLIVFLRVYFLRVT